MMLIFFDSQAHHTLKPFTWTRPVADLRLGIYTLAEKWNAYFSLPFSYQTQPYLQTKYPIASSKSYIFINATIVAHLNLAEEIKTLEPHQALVYQNTLIAFKSNTWVEEAEIPSLFQNFKAKESQYEVKQVIYPEDLIKFNADEIKNDFAILTKGKTSHTLSNSNHLLGEDLFVESNVYAECCTFNTQNGPIYIAKNAIIMEGSHLRGPIFIGENSVVKMGSKIYGGSSIGPSCTVGSEIKNSIFWGNSNKGHDGYIGDSVIGEWCNFGAGSCNSNMKNNLGVVKLWDYTQKKHRNTGLNFCGLMMGDHSKCGINTSFNTGSVVGVCCNIVTNEISSTFIPDFSWKNETYTLEKALKTIEISLKRKNIKLDSVNKFIFNHIFNETQEFREKTDN